MFTLDFLLTWDKKNGAELAGSFNYPQKELSKIAMKWQWFEYISIRITGQLVKENLSMKINEEFDSLWT